MFETKIKFGPLSLVSFERIVQEQFQAKKLIKDGRPPELVQPNLVKEFHPIHNIHAVR